MFDRDPADLFVQLYDRLEEEPLRDPARVSHWLEPETLDPLIRDFSSRAATGRLDPAEIKRSLETAADRQGLLIALLLALQSALEHVHPWTSAASHGALTRIALRYAETGRLNSDTSSGALLPRFCQPRAAVTPSSRRELFHGLLRVTEDEWASVEHCVLPERHDVSISAPIALTVGCAPAIESIEEVEVEKVRRVLGSHFRLRPKDSEEMRARLRRILDRLDASGAEVGVLPEATLSKELLVYWQGLLRDVGPPAASKLQWILVGTGHVDEGMPPRNTAVLLHRRSGEVLFRQDKLKPFTLSAEQLKEWGLHGLLGTRDIQEDIKCGTRLQVVETRVGRIAVLICEDLARVVELGGVLHGHGVSLIMTPIFSRQIEPFHWEHVKARDYVQEIGTRTVVVNSLVVPRQAGGAAPAQTALVVYPDGHWLGRASAGDDVTWCTVGLSDPSPVSSDESPRATSP